MSPPPVTLQISLAPSDFRHAQFLLPHQINAWRQQVSEVLLTVDLHRSAGRFSAHWEEGRDNLLRFTQSLDDVRVQEVDYGAEAQQRVARQFFGGHGPVPAKDFRGGPYYSYFYALNAATHDYVLHMDSDMFFGGLSQDWLTEALADQAAQTQVLFSAPLPGPPRLDEKLLSQQATPVVGQSHSHNFDTMSTRLFLLSKARFSSAIKTLNAHRPSLRNTIKAFVEGNPAHDLPEHLLSEEMQRHSLVRREFLGSGNGMWHLHPPYRCADFYEKLPLLIARCENGDIPQLQRGDHDINDSLVDWSEATTALQNNRWWQRLTRQYFKA